MCKRDYTIISMIKYHHQLELEFEGWFIIHLPRYSSADGNLQFMMMIARLFDEIFLENSNFSFYFENIFFFWNFTMISSQAREHGCIFKVNPIKHFYYRSFKCKSTVQWWKMQLKFLRVIKVSLRNTWVIYINLQLHNKNVIWIFHAP